MSQSQNVIYYTTAQVTDMVELSDQNVRKYVRLLENRNYEVAKDEHNRRLFSKKDVNVLKEMIRIAKAPGNTLDSAADTIIESQDEFEETESENQVSKMSDNDISRLLAIVLEKLDEIQNENKELKSNISTLVHRLEEYDLKALEYSPEKSEEEETAFVEDTFEEEESPQVTEETEPEVEAAAVPASEELVEEAPTEESADEEAAAEPEVQTETAASEKNNGTVDLSQQEEQTQTVTEEKEVNSEDIAKEQIEAPKKGFFGKLASMFKG
ncbi:hypothetical protein SAMN05216187_10386 [Jeotgalicoccus aerolatus]|uniref:HTH merR-type domain-containing protein n=1 Tax=Jeotgalicoccus aerolatus TaxID=709510 RepID=A0A1G8XA32_9STAP|nr:hypothetical protein [Jeotgalicoccus aerolatus]SDJ86610.1 hypothetical protein SAMN05216187_10386 [Jeotgalicoccus aerolatus]